MTTNPNPLLNINDPFEGLVGGVKATDVSPETQFLKICIMGPPKSGKSLFAVTMPGAKRVYDFDDRKVSIAGTPNCNVITLKDGISQPISVQTIETELSTFKYRKIKGLPIPDVFIFDTVSNWIDNGIKFSYLKENPKDGRSLCIAGALTVQIGISFDRINVTTKFLDYILTEFSALGTVIYIFHERDEKDKAESKKDDPKFTGLVTIEPQFAQNILTFFNEVFRMRVTGSGIANQPAKFEVTTRPNNEVIAATTLLVDSIELPNLAEMIAKSKKKRAEQQNTK